MANPITAFKAIKALAVWLKPYVVKLGAAALKFIPAAYKTISAFAKAHPLAAMVALDYIVDFPGEDFTEGFIGGLTDLFTKDVKGASAPALASQFTEAAKQAPLTNVNFKAQEKQIRQSLSDQGVGRNVQYKNHPKYFYPDTVNSYGKGMYDQTLLSDRSLLSKVVFRNLIIGFDTRIDSLLSVEAENSLYNVYKAWYERQNLNAGTGRQIQYPRTSDEVMADISTMVALSAAAYSTMRVVKRYVDCRKVKLGEVQYADIAPKFCGCGINPSNWQSGNNSITPGVNGSKANHYAAITPYNTYGVSSTSDALTNNRDVTFGLNKPVEIAANNGDDYAAKKFAELSNYNWNQRIAKLREYACLSNDFISELDYFFEGIFIDDTREDKIEAYIFAPFMHLNEGLALWVGQKYAWDWDAPIDQKSRELQADDLDYLKIFDSCVDKIASVYKKDGAYPAILSTLGMEGASWKKDIGDKMRRDVNENTLIIKKAEDSLYEALVNASYWTRFINEGTSTSITSKYGRIQSADTTICKGDPPKFELNKMSARTPQLRQFKRGELASALKFRYGFNLALGPCGYWDGNPGQWLQLPPFINTSLAVTKSGTVQPNGVNYALAEGALTSLIENSYGRFQTQGLPAELQIYMTLFMGGNTVEEPDQIYYQIDTNNLGYDRIELTDPSGDLAGILDNLMIGYYTNKDLQLISLDIARLTNTMV